MVALVASIPARVLAVIVPADRLAMDGYSGTLWQGRVARCVLTTNSGYFHLGAVEWSLDPFSLLTLSPSVRLHSHWGRQKISADVRLEGSNGYSLKNLEASVSARLLQQFLPVAVEGEFAATISQLQIRDGLPTEGEGRLLWRNAGWQSSQGIMPLGSYALDFEQIDGGAMQAIVVTVNGPVEASGSVTFDAGRYDLNILLAGDGGLNSQLKQALSLVAQPVAEGYRIALKGQLKDMEQE